MQSEFDYDGPAFTFYKKGKEDALANVARIDQALEHFALLVRDFTEGDSAGHMQYLHEQAELALAYRALVGATEVK